MDSRSLVVILLLLVGMAQAADYQLNFILRDAGRPYNEDINMSYHRGTMINISYHNTTEEIPLEWYYGWRDYNYGNISFNLTDMFVENGTVLFSVDMAGRGAISLFKDIRITKDGADLSYGPWNTSCSVGDTYPETVNPDYKAQVYRDDRMILVGVINGGVACAQSSPIREAPELRIKQSDLVFNKSAYNITHGNQLQINITVHNTGTANEDNANVTLLINGVVRNDTLLSIPVASSNTTSFYYTTDFGTSNFLSITAIVLPSGDEGILENNKAVKRLVKSRPFLFFTNSSNTQGFIDQDQYPYSTWKATIESTLLDCPSSFTGSDTTAHARCVLYYAEKYSLNKSDNTSAIRAINGLTNSFSGEIELNRSAAGNCTKDSFINCSDVHYGDTCGGALYNFRRKATDYVMALNWVSQWGVDNGYEENITIARDNMARAAADIYLIGKETYTYGEGNSGGWSMCQFGEWWQGKFIFLPPLAWMALELQDYDGQHQDLDGSATEWFLHTENDMLNVSQSGGMEPFVNMVQTNDGIFMEGGGYRYYYNDGEYTFYMAYRLWYENQTLLFTEYDQPNSSIMHLPHFMTPTGRYPQLASSFASEVSSYWFIQDVFPLGSYNRGVINYYINKTLFPDNGFTTKYHDFYDYEHRIFTYNYSETITTPDDIWKTKNGYFQTIRDDWNENELNVLMLAPSEKGFSGHINQKVDHLSINVWGKRAYLTGYGGPERHLTMAPTPYDSGILVSENNFVFWSDLYDEWRFPARNAVSEYGDTSDNPVTPYGVVETDTTKVTGGEFDIVKSNSNSASYSLMDNNLNVKRIAVIVDANFIVDFYNIQTEGGGETAIQYHIPFSTTEYNITPTAAYEYNKYMYGNMSINGVVVDWYNKTVANVSAYNISSEHTNVSKLRWSTLSQTDSIVTGTNQVNFTILFNPIPVNMSVKHYGFHLGEYGIIYDAHAPRILYNRSGNYIGQSNIYYINNESESEPVMNYVSITGGDGNDSASYVVTTGYHTTVWTANGSDVTVNGIKTDAKFGFARYKNASGNFTEVLIGDGIYLNSSYEMLNVSSNWTLDTLVFNKKNDTSYLVHVLGTWGDYTVRLFNVLTSAQVNITDENGYAIDYRYEDTNTTIMFNMTPTTYTTANIILNEVGGSPTTTAATTSSVASTTTTTGGGATTTSPTTTIGGVGQVIFEYNDSIGTEDAFIDSSNPSNNYGGNDYMRMGDEDGFLFIYNVSNSSLNLSHQIDHAELHFRGYVGYFDENETQNVTWYKVNDEVYNNSDLPVCAGSKSGETATDCEIDHDNRPTGANRNATPIATLYINDSGYTQCDEWGNCNWFGETGFHWFSIPVSFAANYTHLNSLDRIVLYAESTELVYVNYAYLLGWSEEMIGSYPYLTENYTFITTTTSSSSSSSTSTTLASPLGYIDTLIGVIMNGGSLR